MAIAYSTIAETSVGSPGGSPFSVTIPAHNSGDLLAVVITTTKSSASPATAINTPSGWTKGPDIEAGNASAVRLTLFLKDGNGSESSVDITLSGSVDFGGGAFCLVLTGADTAADVIDVSGTTVHENETDIDSPTVTATEADVLVLYAYCFDDDLASEADHDSDAGFSGTSRGYIEEPDGEGNANGFSTAVSTKTQGSGATGTCTWSTGTDADAGCAFTVVLKTNPITAPIISTVGDDSEPDTKQNVTITGTNFGATDTGSAEVEIGSTSDHGSATLVIVPRDSWSATSIQVDLEETGTGDPILDTLTAGTLFAFVTDSAGVTSAGFSFTLKEPGATWAAAKNVDLVDVDVASDVQMRVRVEVGNSGGPEALAAKWQSSKNAGTWIDITATSDDVQTAATTHFDDGDDLLEALLTSDPLHTLNNAAEESTGAFTITGTLDTDDAIEAELSFKLISADLSDADTIDFRIVESDSTLLDTYTQTPRITVEKGGGPIEVAAALAASSNLTALEQVDYDGQAALAASSELAGVGALVTDQAAALATSSTLAADAGNVTDQAGALGASFDAASSVIVSVEVSAALAASYELATLSQADRAAAAALALSGNVTALGAMVTDQAATLAASMNLTAAAGLVVDAGATLAASSGLTAAGDVTLEASAALGASLNLAAAAALVADVGATLGSSSNLTAGAELLAEASAVLAASLELVTLAELEGIEVSADLGASFNLTSAMDYIGEGLAELGFSSDLTAENIATLLADAGIAFTGEITPITALETSAEGALLWSVDIVGAGATIAGTLVTPDGRKVVILADGRTVTVLEDTRSVNVLEDSRNVTIH